MSTTLPAITPRRGAGSNRVHSKRQPTTGIPLVRSDPAAGSTETASVEQWTPHDVAEWLFTLSTKEDYTHTFLVHNIDGAALLGMTREQLSDWRIKLVDIGTILKGIADLRRISDGSIGWQPGDDGLHVPHVPKEAKPAKSGRKKQVAAQTAPSAAGGRGDATDQSVAAAEHARVDDGTGAHEAAAPAESEWALTSVPLASTGRSRPSGDAALPSAPPAVGAESPGHHSTARHHGSTPTPRVSAASPTYLRKMMGELHSSERVPLWKEEMVERVKRAATARQQTVEHAMLASARAPRSARLSEGSSRRGLGLDEDASSVVSSRRGGASGGAAAQNSAPSVVDSLTDSGVGARGSAQAREIERKLFWYQDAIHEQELQQQLLDQKIRGLNDEVSQALEHRQSHPQLKGVGAVGMERELMKRQMREKNRLERSLQVSEERVADAERFNKEMMATINKLRHGRADFLSQMSKLEERVTVMTTDMKHFGQAAHASLDEKEKVEARLKRQQFDYRNELSHTEHIFEMLQGELHGLEERIANAHAAEEAYLQQARQDAFHDVMTQRELEQRRELRLGYLQNHLRGQEMDFQRLHRIMGVKFTPEKPDSVQDIVKASLNHEQRNASLLHFVGVQNAEIEEVEEQVRALSRTEEALLVDQAKAADEDLSAKAAAEVSERSLATTMAGITKREDDMLKLCPLVLKLWEMASSVSGGGGEVSGGILALKGCRPDTLSDYLRLIDVSIRDLHLRASSLPTAAGNEWLRDFLQPKVVTSHPSVMELRKELEAAAQKQKEQKEAKTAQDGVPEDTAALTFEPPTEEQIATLNPGAAGESELVDELP